MLKSLRKHAARLPQLRAMQLSPVVSENDELIHEIETSAARHDDQWNLTAGPDTAELDTFWNHVQEDVRRDPTWHTFTDE